MLSQHVFLFTLIRGYFWHLTDMHWDIYYSAKDNRCNRRSETRVGKFYGEVGCEASWELLESGVKAMRQARGDNIEFILWTGDGVKEGKGGLWGLQNLTTLLGHVFSSQFVFPVLGHTEPALHQDLVKLWRHWLPTEALQTFQKGGYYLIEQKSQRLHLIALNTNLWVTDNGVEDPGGQWAWLDTVLSKIYRNRHTVYLVGHIAPGSDERQGRPSRLCLLQQHNEKYIQLINKYAEIIKGQFFSHLHSDTFRLAYNNAGIPVSSIFLAPSVTPKRTSSGSNNPGLRLYKFNTDSGQVLDYSQYFLDLTASNTKKDPEWTIEYNFTRYYEINDVSPNTLHQLAQSFTTQNGKNLFGRYWLANSVRIYSLPTNMAWVNAHYCAITQLDYTMYQNCLMTRASPLEASRGLCLCSLSFVIIISLAFLISVR